MSAWNSSSTELLKLNIGWFYIAVKEWFAPWRLILFHKEGCEKIENQEGRWQTDGNPYQAESRDSHTRTEAGFYEAYWRWRTVSCKYNVKSQEYHVQGKRNRYDQPAFERRWPQRNCLRKKFPHRLMIKPAKSRWLRQASATASRLPVSRIFIRERSRKWCWLRDGRIWNGLRKCMALRMRSERSMIWRKGIEGTKRGVSQPGEHGSVGRLQIKSMDSRNMRCRT